MAAPVAGAGGLGLEEVEPPIPMLVFGRGLVIRWLSAAAATELRRDRDTLIGQSWYDLFPESRARQSEHERLFDPGFTGLDIERKPLTRHGCTRYYSLRLRPLRSPDGAVESIVALGENISALVASEELLRLSEAKFRAVSKHATDLVIISSADGTITFASDSVAHQLGRAPEGRIGTSVLEFLHPDDVPKAAELLRVLAADACVEVPREIEVRKQHADGGWRWFAVSATNLLENPAVRGIVFNARDITARKLTEDALADSQRRLDTALSGSSIGVWQLDVEGGRVSLDDNCARIAGLSSGNCTVARDDWMRAVDRQYRAAARRWARETLADASEWHEFEYPHWLGGGEYRWLMIRGRCEPNPDGGTTRVAGVAMDVTARKLIELDLAAAKASLDAALESSRSALWTIYVEEDRCEMSDSFFQLTGIRPADWARDQHPWNSRMHPEDLPVMRRAYQDHVDGTLGSYEVEYRLRTPQGWRWMHDRGRIVSRRLDGRPLVLSGTTQDSSERRRLEDALAHATQLEQQRLAFDLHDGLGQQLAGIQLLLSSMGKRAKRMDPSLATELEELGAHVRDAIRSTRTIAHGLALSALERSGLEGAIAELVRHMSDTYSVAIEFSTTVGIARPVSDQAAQQLYRICQEALTNARRHSNAERIRVSLEHEGESLVLSISDNGCGIDPASGHTAGIGLQTMAYRARKIGAEFHVGAGPAGGTQIVVRCPVDSRRRPPRAPVEDNSPIWLWPRAPGR